MILSVINQVPITSNTLYLGIEIAIGVVVSVIYVRARVPKETIKEQADLIKILQQKSDEQTKNLADYKAQLAHLTGQLEAYKELPLQEIASGMTKIASSNDKILATLQKSALIVATDKLSS